MKTVKGIFSVTLSFTVLILACAGCRSNVSKYALVVIAGRGKLLLAHRVVYAVDEYGNSLNLNIPKEKDIGSDPSWSPDGQWIAHIVDGDIYIMSTLDNNKNIRVTSMLWSATTPSWSPDGSKIAFDSFNPDVQYRHGIYLLNVECVLQGKICTPEPIFLTSGVYPDWSPDGNKIVYQIYDHGIYVIDVQNAGESINISQCGSFPHWSPDGTKIAFACDGSIYVVDPDGNNRVSYAIDAFDTKWSPDGKKIAFIGTESLDPHLGQVLDLEGMDTSTAVFIMDTNGKNITRLTKSNEESIGSITWISTDRIKP